MTTNETILDLIMRDIACDNSLKHVADQLNILNSKRADIIAERKSIAEKLTAFLFSVPARSEYQNFLLPTGAVATVSQNGTVYIQDVTKL
jgi:hypothetical protein